jgi:hypothetical protein
MQSTQEDLLVINKKLKNINDKLYTVTKENNIEMFSKINDNLENAKKELLSVFEFINKSLQK